MVRVSLSSHTPQVAQSPWWGQHRPHKHLPAHTSPYTGQERRSRSLPATYVGLELETDEGGSSVDPYSLLHGPPVSSPVIMGS